MAVAGVDVWLNSGILSVGLEGCVEYIRDCHLSSAVDVSRKFTHGLQLMEVRVNIHPRMEL